jgi:hypothetical protein
MKLYNLEPKAFKMRFKLNRPHFDDLVEKTNHVVKVNKRGKEMAKRSSESFVPSALQLAPTWRWLASAHYACQEDNYSLGISTFFACLRKVIYALGFVYLVGTSTRKTRVCFKHMQMVCMSRVGDSSRDVSALLTAWLFA